MAQKSPLVRKDPRICAPNRENTSSVGLKGSTLEFCIRTLPFAKFQAKMAAFAALAGFCVLSSTFLGFFVLHSKSPKKFRAIPCNSVQFRGGVRGGVQCSKTGLKKTHGFPCYSVLFRAIPCYSVQFRAIPCYAVQLRGGGVLRACWLSTTI